MTCNIDALIGVLPAPTCFWQCIYIFCHLLLGSRLLMSPA
jgi:hypothetical protein